MAKLIYSQVVNWSLIGLGVYSKTWDFAGKIMGAAGLAPSRTVRLQLTIW